MVQVGSLVWVQLSARTRHYPAIVLDGELCGQKPAAKERLWVCWLAEYRVSEVSINNVHSFVLAFRRCLSKIGGKRYLAAVDEAIKVIVDRSGMSLPDNMDLVAWFLENSPSLDAHVIGSAVLKALGIPRPAVPTRQAEQIATDKQSQRKDLCIACDTALPLGDTRTQHPLVEGAVCEDCRENLLESLFAIALDGTCAYCFICGYGDVLFICDNVDCGRCICSQCLERLIGEREPEKVSRCSPWHCNICEGRSAGRLQPWPDWEARVIEFFKNPQAVVPPVPDQLPRRSLRVLSLFDGIATGGTTERHRRVLAALNFGSSALPCHKMAEAVTWVAHSCASRKYVLDQLGLSVEAYYASEVDKDAIHVGLTRHGSSIIYLGPVEHLKDQKLQELCPIDLLIGGSPCNDLANVNPNKKGLYDPTGTGILFFEFYRVLRTVLQANGGRHLFWMFENVVAMPREYRRVISRFLQVSAWWICLAG
ncbi:hypothetical protein MRX96_007248 [Rhipicephalus microplus]